MIDPQIGEILLLAVQDAGAATPADGLLEMGDGAAPSSREREVASFGMVDPMVLVDNADNVVSLNPAAESLFGVRSTSIIGESLDGLWPGWRGEEGLFLASGTESDGGSVETVSSSSSRRVFVYPVIGSRNDCIGRAIVMAGNSGRCGVDKGFVIPDWLPLKATESAPQVRAVTGSGADVASVLAHVAWQLGETTDATSVYICGWDANTELAIVLAEYMGPDVSEHEQVSDLGTCYVEGHRRFLPVLEKGQPWIEHSDDPSIPADDLEHLERYGAKSILYIPFVVRGHLVGWAEIWESRRRRAFLPRTVDLAQNIARIAAVAIDKAQLYERMQAELRERRGAEEALQQLNDELEQRVRKRTRELAEANAELLHEIAERRQAEADLLQRNRVLLSLQSAIASTSGSLDLEFLLDTISREMAQLLDIETCTVYHWDKDDHALTTLSARATGEQGGDTTLRLATAPLHKRVLEEATPFHVTARQEEFYPPQARHLEQASAKTLLLIPMVFHGCTVGVIELRDRSVERIFGDYEMSAAQLLASQAAAAIENARLYGYAQREIIDRIFAEDRLRASLAEKEVLLKEIHHRVKNNLQVISSILSLQAFEIKDPDVLKAFRESQDRVRSMALIHEKLYRSEDLAEVDFAGYLEDLAGYLVRAYQPADRPVRLGIEAGGVRLSVDQAVPCGLIVNELVSNALKHAFPVDTGRPPSAGVNRIEVKLLPAGDGTLELMVGDNGVGFRDKADTVPTDSLGLRMVRTLVGQIDGVIDMETGPGTVFRITFPVLEKN